MRTTKITFAATRLTAQTLCDGYMGLTENNQGDVLATAVD